MYVCVLFQFIYVEHILWGCKHPTNESGESTDAYWCHASQLTDTFLLLDHLKKSWNVIGATISNGVGLWHSRLWTREARKGVLAYDFGDMSES